MRRRSGDGFLRCSDGKVRWGLFGAAGALFAVPGGEAPRVMLQLRSAAAHEGGTWSCPGGALDEGETPMEGALREAGEEVGPVPGHRVLGEHTFAPAVDWSYTTVVLEVPAPFGEPLTFETTLVEWVPLPEVGERGLHPGFAAAWPALAEIVRREVGDGRR